LEERPLKVAVIADTHIPGSGRPLPAALLRHLREVALIIHLGDVTSPEVLAHLEEHAPVVGIAGNADLPEIRQHWPRRRVLTLARWRIGLVHGDAGPTPLAAARRAFADDPVDCVLFGHSHTPYRAVLGEVLFLNPGSPTLPREAPAPSFALLHLADRLEGEIVYLPPGRRG